jgi:hypothetical protein
MREAKPTDLTVLFQRRPGTEHARDGITFANYDIAWPDARRVRTGLTCFCSSGARLLLGRHFDGQTALVRLTIYPVAGLDAALTRPGNSSRCRRFYALRHGDSIRLHFLDGTPTEAVFRASADEPPVIRWLQAERMRPGEPFWFDLVSHTLMENAQSPAK